MLRNVIIALLLLTLSATAARSADRHASRASRSSAAHSRYPNAGLHRHTAARPKSPRAVHTASPSRSRRANHRTSASLRRSSISTHRTVPARAPRRVSARTERAHLRTTLHTIRPARHFPAPIVPVESPAEPVSYRAYRRMPMPAPLRGSFESLARQNEITEAEGLERIQNDEDLNERIEHHLLVPVPTSTALLVNSELPYNRRYCRPWTARFLADFARLHAAIFHRPLMVSSAVRTVQYQKRLMLVNGNAAAAEGDIVSPHVTGATIDIAKGTLSRQELAWARSYLLRLQDAGKIDVEEEFQQACFHITVYTTYAPAPVPRRTRRQPAPDTELASRGR